MNVPMPAAPPPAGVAPASSSGSGASPASAQGSAAPDALGFEGLVQMHLAQGECGDTAKAGADGSAVGSAESTGAEGTADSGVLSAAAPASPQVPAPPVGQVVGPVLGTVVNPAVGAGVGSGTTAADGVAGPADASPGAGPQGIGTSATATTGPAGDPDTALGGAETGRTGSPDTRETTAGSPAAGSSALPTGGESSASTGLTASTGVSAGTAAGATTSASSQPAGPVGAQVFPEVMRLVTRGDGTQRLTLRLSPENLGDVRIVVTVRDGAVDVTLAAGADAQEALRHGSPELRRLLENIGAASTQIAVKDLPTAQASSQTFGSGSGPAYSGSTGPGTNGRQHNDGHPAGQHAPSGRPGPTAHHNNHPTDQTPAAAGVDLRL